MQEFLVLMIFIGAISYLGRRLYLRSQKKAACGPDCGCEPKSVPLSQAKE